MRGRQAADGAQRAGPEPRLSPLGIFVTLLPFLEYDDRRIFSWSFHGAGE